MSQKQNSPALIFIFLTLLIDVIGLGIIIPVMPDLLVKMNGCTVEEANVYGGWLNFAFSGMQFLFSPLLGALSDKFGRRPILLFSIFGFGIDYLLLGFAPNYAWLFIGRIVAGITGASFTTATAYIADVSPPEKRAANFGLVGAAFGIGFILGPLIGGLLGQHSLHLPFFVAAGLSLANFAFGFFVLPESLKPEHRRNFSWKRANPLGALTHARKYPALLGLVFTFFMINLAGQSLPNIWNYFTQSTLGWDRAMVGYSLGAVGLSIAIVQGGLNRKIIPWLGEKKSIITGMIMYTIGMTVSGLAPSTLVMFLGLVPLALGGLAGPTLQSISSRLVPADEQGELQGLITSTMSISAIIGPLLYPGLFYYFSSEEAFIHVPGMPFFCSAFFTLASMFIAVRALRKLNIR